MTPEKLSAKSFAAYPPAARQFAVEHLPLLQRLPLTTAPSFLQQIQGFDTLFPAERDLLRWQCDALQALPPEQLGRLTQPLAALRVSDPLRSVDWVAAPDRFVVDLTAYLWSSNQINEFRKGISDLFATIPPRHDGTQRFVVVVLGQGAEVDPKKVLRKLRARGVYLNAVQHESAFTEIRELLQSEPYRPAPYAGWYVDGGEPRPEFRDALGAGGLVVTYPGVEPVRRRVLERMQATISSRNSGPEQMRTRLMETSAEETGAALVTTDPVLQRFYTELFTESSGPQIFSTTFVQWTGRELARRAQPARLLLRYAPRQRHQDMNAMFAETTPVPDPQGSLRDAEMGAFYNWLEMSRITAPGKLTFLAWVENQPLAVVLSANAPAGTVCSTPMTLKEAVQNFG